MANSCMGGCTSSGSLLYKRKKNKILNLRFYLVDSVVEVLASYFFLACFLSFFLNLIFFLVESVFSIFFFLFFLGRRRVFFLFS